MAVTLTEVAAAAGVSLATASRAFKEPERLSAGTRDKVRAIARDLGYPTVPSTSPTSTRPLGVVVPDIGSAVFADLVRAVHDRALPAGRRLLLASTHEDPTSERTALRDLAPDVDGLLLCSPRLPAEDVLDAVGDTPLVVINGLVPGTPTVLTDVRDGLRQAVDQLRALGHRHVAYVPGPQAAWASRRRQEVLADLCAGAGLELTVTGRQAPTVTGGLAAAASVVATGATAVIAYNDLMAVGVMSGARALGVRCPDDLSVVGMDDLDLSAAVQPGLTSVQVAVTRSGGSAVDLLLDRLSGRPSAPSTLHLDSQLVVRGSTGPAPR
ncbi:LacI family DNA-binding transcriptional regulator [Kineococcus gynurae]|uniref:LacI family DNA-binding transcriptional regulator n=1 Tax=Kineococcus gynurae TaxID=452979 RepID=A0ABV5LW90_9ACTN